MRLYYENDADLKRLENKTVAVIGYGSQGHAHALNLRDSGINVVVGLREGSASIEAAKKEGLEVASVSRAAEMGDIIMMLAPDQNQAEIFNNNIVQHLKPGNALAVAHGFSVHFKQVVPPENVDVFMVAPKAPGHLARRVYTQGGGVPCLIAVYQDASGKCKDTALAYAKGIGGTRAGVIETDFREETETDLFGEQAVLCGGVTELIRSGFEVLVEDGYQPEIAYFECLHELKLIVDLLYEGGIRRMYYSVSETAEYGGMTKGPYVIDESVKERMKEVLAKVKNGDFAEKWIAENRNGQENFKAMRDRYDNLHIESVGAELRKMMSWLNN